ncbi:peptidylprolyl isomerase [Candidatus Poriferisodalis sp.]|uniref:peptidylprolyl isomerase n=1 Tax=Candidatus Poriferisodalis sp. TaxID=3101277 RepID=UPI003B02E0D3
MASEKRQRQRENRMRAIAEAERAKKRSATGRTVLRVVFVVAAVLIALWLWSVFSGDDAADSDSEIDEIDVEAPEAAAFETAEPSADTTSPRTDDEPVSTSPSADAADAVPSEIPEGCPALDGTSERVIDFDTRQPMCIDPAASYTAVFDTSEGEMRFELTAEATPETVNNFVTLARWGYYDETLLFRTDPSIHIIQGGSPHTNTASDPGPGYTIPDEPQFEVDPNTANPIGPYRYRPGQLVMARAAGFNSAGAQFFITTGTNAALLDSQGTYVVFGQTDDAGLTVAEAIIGLHEPGGSLGGAPSRPVTVHSVTIETDALGR